jgi:hypothetical protein
VEALLTTAHKNIGNLSARSDPEARSENKERGACDLIEHQLRLNLLQPTTCNDLQQTIQKTGRLVAHFAQRDSKLLIVGGANGSGCMKARNGAPASPDGCPVQVEVLVNVLLEEIPFGDAFEQVLVVDGDGERIGNVVSPRPDSPMLPPRSAAPTPASPLRVLDIGRLSATSGTAADKEKQPGASTPEEATLVRRIEFAGKRYTLMCQPWSAKLSPGQNPWWLCGLVDSRNAYRQALRVAPQLVVLMAALVVLVIVSWPILKVLFVAPRERIHFADIYAKLLATLALVMLAAVWAFDFGTYAHLSERSTARLHMLAVQLETNLQAELRDMYRQLQVYDEALSGAASGIKWPTEVDAATKVGCLRLQSPQRQSPGSDCEKTGTLDPLQPPRDYEHLALAFWMRPCDGAQFFKVATARGVTSAVKLGEREYFQAVKADRLWHPWAESREGLYVDTSASVTNGEFFAALSMPSMLSYELGDELFQGMRDCTAKESTRVVAAMTTLPISFRYPVLAPGVGFAIVNETGRVLFHSDERRAVLGENLFEDQGLSQQLRAALAVRAQVDFEGYYQTHRHQIHIRPLAGLPWALLTFADDEVLRTAHAELLLRTGVLVGGFLLIALLATLGYLLVRGRRAPTWMWPHLQPRHRKIYVTTLCGLVALLAITAQGLAVLRGDVLFAASLLMPAPAIVMIVLATMLCARLDAQPGKSAAVHRLHHRGTLAIVIATALLLPAAVLAMHVLDPIAAGYPVTGVRWLACAVVVLLAIAGVAFVPKRWITTSQLIAKRIAPPWWRPKPVRLHIACTVILWLDVGALPAYGLYKLALDGELATMTRAEQAYVARSHAWRGCRIEQDFRLIPTTFPEQSLDARLQVTAQSASRARYGDIYPVARLFPAAERPADRNEKLLADSSAILRLWKKIAAVAPIYNETTIYSRYLEAAAMRASTPAGHWSWRIEPAANPVLVYRHAAAGACDTFIPRFIESRLPFETPRFGWQGLLACLGVLLLLSATTSFVARKLFCGEIPRTADTHDDWPWLDPHGDAQDDRPPDQAWAEAELEPIRQSAALLPRPEELCELDSRRAALERVLEAARSDYTAKWDALGEDERLLLIQLVEEGFTNPRQSTIVRRLLKDGLLRRDPVLRTMNHSFALFVAGNSIPEDVARRERATSEMSWNGIRNLLLAGLVLAFLFLAVTQRDTVDTLVGYLGAAATGTLGVLKLLSLISRPGAQKTGE